MRLKGFDQKCSTLLCLKWSRGFSETPEAEEHWALEWSPVLRQVVKTQNPLNGELSHGVVTQAVHEGV